MRYLKLFILPVLVYWTSHFSADGRSWTETRKAMEFETPRQMAEFITMGPQEGSYFSCEQDGTRGKCFISDLEVR